MLQPSPSTTGVVTTVSRFTDFIVQYAIVLGAVGALSLALIEAGKRLLDSRTKFQARRWTRWMMDTPVETGLIFLSGGSESPHELTVLDVRTAALADLLQLCTGVPAPEAQSAAENLIDSDGRLPTWHAFSPRSANALFALDIGRMMGSIQEAADVALASPRQHRALYLVMTSGAERSDISRWYEEGAPSMSDIAETEPSPEQRRRIKDHADRFARLRQIIKRKLDGFHLYTGDRWASWNQFCATALGSVVMFGALMWVRQNIPETSLGLMPIIVFSLLGGILSPIAKDIVSPIAKEVVSALKRVKDG